MKAIQQHKNPSRRVVSSYHNNIINKPTTARATRRRFVACYFVGGLSVVDIRPVGHGQTK